MKILHITKKYPPALGGDAVVVSNLQKHQKIAGYSVSIVTSNCEGAKTNSHVHTFGLKDTPANLDAITVRRLISLFMLFFKIFRILQKEKPDIIHTHSVDMAFIISFAARAFAIPIVHTFHIVTFYDGNQSFLRRSSELWLMRRTQAKRITAPNIHDVEMLREAGFSQTVLLPNGVDINFWETIEAPAHSDAFHFIAVGRLERQKGYTYLVEAAALLAKEVSQKFIVTIVGDGGDKESLQNQAKNLGINHNIIFTGRRSAEEIRALFSQAQVAVFPSLYETTPLTLLEAWAASLPVISTPVGILKNTPHSAACRLVHIKDSVALKNAMREMMEDSSIRQTLIKNGNEEVQQYAWPFIAKSADTIYRSL